MATIQVDVNPEVLRWARETAGFSVEDASRKLSIGAAYGRQAAERLTRIENGDDSPTRTLLLKMEKLYRRPLIAFYLERIPPKGDRGQDFRTLQRDDEPEREALVDALLRNIKARQSTVRAVLEAEDDAPAIQFIGSATVEMGVVRVAELVEAAIGFDLATFRQRKTLTDAFTYARDVVEAAGVFVLLVGDLGSHHSQIPVNSFRGFALADPIAPFIVINDQDSRAAWSFTLLHEVVHLLLGQTGISGTASDAGPEAFCNDVAGTLLLPIEELDEFDATDRLDLATNADLVSAFADQRNVSRTMVAYRLYRSGRISRDMYGALARTFLEEWLAARAAEKKGDADASGPSYYTVRRHRSGRALVDLVARTLESNAMSSTQAAQVLNVRARNVYELVRR